MKPLSKKDLATQVLFFVLGFNDKLLVKKGDQVVRGQVVAQVGSTGRVDSPQLHFEMRKGSRAVNPIQYLRS